MLPVFLYMLVNYTLISWQYEWQEKPVVNVCTFIGLHFRKKGSIRGKSPNDLLRQNLM